MSSVVRTFRLKCPQCQHAVICDETILDAHDPCCADCGHPIDVDRYEALRKLKAENQAAKQAEVARKKREKEEQREAKKREQQERKILKDILRRSREEAAVEAMEAKLQERKQWQQEQGLLREDTGRVLICSNPNCGFKGSIQGVSQFNAFFFWILFLFIFALGGIVYAL